MKKVWPILVVDDEPLVCETVKMLLVADGHKVETATSGKEALALLEKGTFDLILIDYAMPVMKGDELAAAVKARLPNQPIVIFSASAQMLQSSANPLVEGYFILSKPFSPEDLREAIAKALPNA